MATDVEVIRRRFTVDEYHRMGEAGILNEDDRVELVRGEIVQMSPIGIQHAACVARLTEILLGRLRGRATLWPQNPLTILPDRSEERRVGKEWRTRCAAQSQRSSRDA